MPRFTNLNPDHRRPNGFELLRWSLIDRLLGRRKVAPAGEPAPCVEPDLDAIEAGGGEIRLTWIGHASFLLSCENANLLLDPVFSDRIGPKYRRHVPPGLIAAELPRIDAVLISHNHYDHLDARSIDALPRTTQIVAPAGLGKWFRRRGFAQVDELEWWDSVELGSSRVTLVPARHWSQRGPLDYNRSHWGGYVVKQGEAAVYHCGDSAWFEGFAEIGRRFPNLRAALMPIGGYRPGWFMQRNHMTPEQAGEAFAHVGARTLIPMHWGTFQLTDEPLREPIERLRVWWNEHGGEPNDLIVPAVGETVCL